MNGETAYHFAARKANEQVVKLLASYGADPLVVSNEGTANKIIKTFSNAPESFLKSLQDIKKQSKLKFDLPLEIQVQVFSYLDTADLCFLSMVCKELYVVSSLNCIWERHFKVKEEVKEGQVKKLYIDWVRNLMKAWHLKDSALQVLLKKRLNIGTTEGVKPDYDMLVKILLVGNSGVGKSSFLSRYVEGQYTDDYTSTIGAGFMLKTVDFCGLKIQTQLWVFY
eukprot:TRINITY_DN2637_c0_g1_i14.p1 TRINITY_DN2637_c0_g1~~TRINITY_DN2637_c0_g1_i14.p1  ORF type:complete len:224 (+),score=26.78 TRINITY_DN2637_c0_g1_i14:540-1211(+)